MMVESKQAHLQSLVFTFFLLYWNPIPIRAKEVEHEIEFQYSDGEIGPEHWGGLKKEWADCKDGKFQSPIGLSDDRATKVIPRLGDLKMSHKASNATIKNEGHHISIAWKGDAGSIQINGIDYFLIHCHWHIPSEHSINGIRYDLELHMVHRNPDTKMKNNKAVLAFLYKIGNPNPFLSKVSKEIKSLVDTKEIHLGEIDPREIKWTSFRFYRYMGSLTTPPCQEGVIWTINERVTTVSGEQVELLKQAASHHTVMNARPLQPHNDRDIKLYALSDKGSHGSIDESTLQMDDEEDLKQYRSISAQSPQEGNQRSKQYGSINAPSPNQSPKRSLRLFPQVVSCIFAYLFSITDYLLD